MEFNTKRMQAVRLMQIAELLAEEIRIVKPRKIIAFGGLVYKTLTGKNIKLTEYWNGHKKENNFEIISGLKISVTPCYFPIGRGNPKKAVEVLKKCCGE